MRADITNADRAGWALSALTGFIDSTRVDDEADAIGDLITNLLHLARAQGLDAASIARRALAMMETEAAEDEEGDMTAPAQQLSRLIEASSASSMALFR
jgi:hypothetical protein